MSTQPTPQPDQVSASVEGTQAPVAAAPTPPPTSGGMFDKVLGALAGNPKTYSVDQNTGVETGQPVTDRGSLAKHIVAAAIVGMLKGAGQRGPNSLGQAAAAGGAAGFGLAQQENQQAKQEPLENYQRQQEAATAKANALAKNLQLRSMQQSLSDQDEKAHQQIVANSADQIARLKAEGNTPEAEGVPEDEAKDPTKHNILDQRIPDGVTPKLGPNGEQEKDADGVPLWQQTYTIFDRHSESSVAGAPWVQQAVDWGIPGAKAVAGMGPNDKLSLPGQNHYIFTLGQLQTMQSELDAFAKKVGASPVDLKAMVNKDPSLIEAVNQFQRTSGASTQPDLQLDAMRQDPKAAPYAGRIMGMFGADNLEKFKQDRLQTNAANIEAAKTAAAEQERIKAEGSPQAINAAARKGAAVKRAEAEVDDTPVVAYDPHIKNADGTTGGNIVTTRGQADLNGLMHYKVDASMVNSTVGGFNDVQNKINMLADVVNDPKRAPHVQSGLAAAMLAHSKGIEVGAFGTHIDMTRINESLYKDDLKKANQATKDYVAAMGAAHEAITQLPRLQTFGKSSRMTQQQMEAAQNMLPGPADMADPTMGKQKLLTLQTTLDPLRKQLPHMAGAELLPTWLETSQH